MIIFDEKLADILEDGNARRGWWMNLREEQDAERSRMIDFHNSIQDEKELVAA